MCMINGMFVKTVDTKSSKSLDAVEKKNQQ